MKTTDTDYARPLTRKEAARYFASELGYPMSPLTLEAMASRGNGPRYFKVSRRVFYRKSDLKEWIDSRTSPMFKSTSDQAATKGDLSCPR